MTHRWAKLLPYFIVMYFTKKMGPDCELKFNNDYVVGWRLDKGEWIIWNRDNYKRMKENEEEQRQKKLSKKRAQYEKLKREFEPEPDEDDDY